MGNARTSYRIIPGSLQETRLAFPCRTVLEARGGAELAAYLAGLHAAIITGSMQTMDGGFGA